jgi:alkaline phosphatase D
MKRRKFIFQTGAGVFGMMPVFSRLFASPTAVAAGEGPFLATGIKIGEVDGTSAVVWARLTKDAAPVDNKRSIPTVLYLDEAVGEWHPVSYFKEKYKQDRPDREVKVVYPDGCDVHTLHGAAPGAPGFVRVSIRKKGVRGWRAGEWNGVDEQHDYTFQSRVSGLEADTVYEVKVEARGKSSGRVTAGMEGVFRTAIPADKQKEVRFTVTTCHEYNDMDDPGKGFKIYRHMQALDPAFMVHTGDVIYYDHWAKDLPMAYWGWQRMFSLETCREFYSKVPCYFMKDDHDTWMNDCYPGWNNRFMGKFTFGQGVEAFRRQVPYGDVPYRTFRWGKDLQIWVTEGREYRSPNTMEDGPDKTIWGRQQLEWFRNSFAASDATFRVLVNATPIVGPDRWQKKDNHANSGFAHEGNLIREFLAAQKNAFIVCGDRHWQYASKELKTGLMEFACGPGSNEHASGWDKNNVLPEHRYLNIVGGFLGVEVRPAAEGARIVFTHYGVDGETLHREEFAAV